MNCSNKKEISCFGLRRSGNHAIIHWLIRQNNDQFVFLNDVKLYDSYDPYESFSKVTIGGISPLVYHRGFIKYKRYMKYILNRKVEYLYGQERSDLDRENLRNWKSKPMLVHSYEHYSLSQVLPRFEDKRNHYLGKSESRFDLVIVRDPYNTFASLIKRGEFDPKSWRYVSPKVIVERWIEHAREFLGFTRYLKHQIGVSYNHWFYDKDYRIKLAEKLELPFTDEGIATVPKFGKGSSFDGDKYDGQAARMDTLSRYKDFLDHPIMQEVLAHHELNELSREIFGEVVG
jgi:hypothetical protein